jgi:hypothetical protein
MPDVHAGTPPDARHRLLTVCGGTDIGRRRADCGPLETRARAPGGRMRRLGLAMVFMTSLACGSRAGGQPPQSAAVAGAEWDAGLPPPARSPAKGVIVPSDVGMGAGPSGPTTNSGSSPAINLAPGAMSN